MEPSRKRVTPVLLNYGTISICKSDNAVFLKQEVSDMSGFSRRLKMRPT
jgi:hypothetical protein